MFISIMIMFFGCFCICWGIDGEFIFWYINYKKKKNLCVIIYETHQHRSTFLTEDFFSRFFVLFKRILGIVHPPSSFHPSQNEAARISEILGPINETMESWEMHTTSWLFLKDCSFSNFQDYKKGFPSSLWDRHKLFRLYIIIWYHFNSDKWIIMLT